LTHNDIIAKYPDYKSTCPANDLHDGCITFIRNINHSSLGKHKDVIIIVPKGTANLIPEGWNYEFVDHVDYTFAMIHNELNKTTNPKKNIIGKNCYIHPTAILDVEGMHVSKAPNGSRVQLKHIGNVTIEDNVMILALATIQRVVFGSTIIKKGAKIDSHVNIGHNSYIGKNTVIALGSILGGSTIIGKNCMVGLGAIIRNGTSICDNVIIGQGSNVVSDIKEPGIYMGSPAKLFKPYDKDWNF